MPLAAKDRVQDAKVIVGPAKAERGIQAQTHRKLGWLRGFCDSLERGERFQVTRIVVKPGERLSLRMHRSCAERWTVVRGTAPVRRGGHRSRCSRIYSGIHRTPSIAPICLVSPGVFRQCATVSAGKSDNSIPLRAYSHYADPATQARLRRKHKAL
ncbi:hypothetical protein PQR02_13835 [Paraburkholderia sediminicola]|uniref:Uncharacterized protein n=1 Tax=Paraburkholderia rhynchosiae TaxID=487049 RepID=A0ACC7NGZ9_9BURK